MAFEQNPYALKITLVADSTLSGTQQFRFVKIATGTSGTGTNDATVCTTATDRPIGVLQNSPVSHTSGKAEAEVTVSGVTKVQVGSGGVSVGDALTIDSSGNAVKYTFPSSETVTGTGTIAAVAVNFIVGTALTAGASGDIVAATVNCSALTRGA